MVPPPPPRQARAACSSCCVGGLDVAEPLPGHIQSMAGGRFVVQDEATSVVWGMPGAAAKTGLAEAVLPLNQIAPWVRRACA